MPQASKAGTPHSTTFARSPDAKVRMPLNRVYEIKQRLMTLEARDVELIECQKRIERERAEVAAAIAEAEADLDAAVAAPVAGGQDPTLWLPDELLLSILVKVAMLEDTRGSSVVCRRWRRLCLDQSVKDAWKYARWVLYAGGKREPRLLDANTNGVITTMCAGAGRTMYCGTAGGCIQVRSDNDGSLMQVLSGHTDHVRALAVGLDGILYSASDDTTIRAWSGETQAHIRALKGHTHRVLALAVNAEKLFSGSYDGTIRVWECCSGHLVHTIPEMAWAVMSLALDGCNLYSGHNDYAIRVWSLTDYTLIRTLEGHSGSAGLLVVDKLGTLYSGSSDRSIRVWSGTDGALLRTLDGSTGVLQWLAFAPNGTLFSSVHTCENTFRVWQAEGRTPLDVVVPNSSPGWIQACAFSSDGHLWVVSGLSRGSLWMY